MILNIIPESLELLIFGIGLIVFTMVLRWLLNRIEMFEKSNSRKIAELVEQTRVEF